ncbi:MAG: hypothetical protein HWE11_07210 [Gammaproteobacteria bacterium]|nr:hypothetical protein [Gammaproteobacteria bacterium]
MPIIVAILGNLVIFGGFYFAGKLENKWLTLCSKIVSAVLGFLIVALAPMTGLISNEEAQVSTKYWFYILIVGAIASAVLGKKRKNSTPA